MIGLISEESCGAIQCADQCISYNICCLDASNRTYLLPIIDNLLPVCDKNQKSIRLSSVGEGN